MKYYVVWEGREPGVYDSWEDCAEQVEGFPGARYKSFPDKDLAVKAYRGDASEYINFYRKLGSRPADVVTEAPDYTRFPEIRPDGIAVDGACAKNPGPIEYRGVRVGTGEELFHFGPLDGGTNNIAEYLALVHVLAMLEKQGDDGRTVIYSDSRTAQGWLARGRSNTKITPTPQNARLIEILRRADAWRATHTPRNPIIKWDTEHWGEIPADFGRK